MLYSELPIKEGISKSFFTGYQSGIVFPTHIYVSGLSYLTKCKEEANKYSFRAKWIHDNPEFVKAYFVGNDRLINNEFLYNKFREIEKSYGLPESKISILDFPHPYDISYKPCQTLVFESFTRPVERDILIILLKKCIANIAIESIYYDSKGIVELIFSDLSFYLPKLDDIFAKKVDFKALLQESCSLFGVKSWSENGYLDDVLNLKKELQSA